MSDVDCLFCGQKAVGFFARSSVLAVKALSANTAGHTE